MNSIIDHASNHYNQSQYETGAEEYLANNTDGQIGGGTPESRVAMVAAVLPKGRTILEIGSGGGLDALALQAAGFNVIASDYVPEFINALNRQGLRTMVFDAKNDEIVQKYAAMYANAVFIHFNPDELTDFLSRAHSKLDQERIIFASFLPGEGQQRTIRDGVECDICYYNLESIESLVTPLDYRIIGYQEAQDWLQVLLQAY